MKVTLKPVQAWEVSVNGHALGLMHESSRWEGMLKLADPKTPHSVLIVDQPGHMAESFARIGLGGSDVVVDVVKIAPSLLAQLPADVRAAALRHIDTKAAP